MQHGQGELLERLQSKLLHDPVPKGSRHRPTIAIRRKDRARSVRPVALVDDPSLCIQYMRPEPLPRRFSRPRPGGRLQRMARGHKERARRVHVRLCMHRVRHPVAVSHAPIRCLHGLQRRLQHLDRPGVFRRVHLHHSIQDKRCRTRRRKDLANTPSLRFGRRPVKPIERRVHRLGLSSRRIRRFEELHDSIDSIGISILLNGFKRDANPSVQVVQQGFGFRLAARSLKDHRDHCSIIEVRQVLEVRSAPVAGWNARAGIS